MNVRPEAPADYAVIARVNARAFDNRAAEPVIVDLHRHRTRFDPELSLVAEIDGRIIAHVLFSPQTIRLLGQGVEAVNLAPIAVDPDYQRQGIGGALIREGHAAARAKGYALSYLLGHTEYYPRFGYRTRAYGSSSLRVSAERLPVDGQYHPIVQRSPTEADLPVLRDLWRHEEGNVDFAVYPGDDLLDWISPNPAIQSLVFTEDGEILGYARLNDERATMFLARDDDAALHIASMIGEGKELPLHPSSASVNALGAPTCSAWEAGMEVSLAPNPFDDYYAQMQAGTRVPGRVIWGVEFETAI